MHEFPQPKHRVRRIVQQALDGTSYVSSRMEDGAILVLRAKRPDGRGVGVRFRGVSDSETTVEPEPGVPLRVAKVSGRFEFPIVGALLAILKPPGPPYARVTIEAGAARLVIVCQDAEWWEDEASPH